MFGKRRTPTATHRSPSTTQRHHIQPTSATIFNRRQHTIWENETPTGKRHNVTIARLYKDDDEWKRTESFGRDDLPLVAKVADLAHSWIFEQPNA